MVYHAMARMCCFRRAQTAGGGEGRDSSEGGEAVAGEETGQREGEIERPQQTAERERVFPRDRR